jgi:hypothetical protein
MSEEMVTLTSDSPAGASDSGAANAIMDMVRDTVDPGSIAQDVNNTGVQESYDVYDLLGVDQTPTQPVAQEEPNPVPYDRFREVNERAKSANDRLSRWGDVISEFERQGFGSAADVQAALIQQQQQAQEQAIVDRYRELEQQELLDPQTSQLQMAAELERFRYQQAMQQVSQFMLDQQKSSSYAQYPLAKKNEAMVDDLVSRGVQPTEAVRIVHEQVDRLTKALVPELLSRMQKGQAAPTPSGSGNSARPAIANGGQPVSQGARSSLSQLLGIGQNRKSI